MYKFFNGKKLIVPKGKKRAFEVNSMWLPERITVFAQSQPEAVDIVSKEFNMPSNAVYGVRPI